MQGIASYSDNISYYLYLNFSKMKGISYITDEKSRKKAVVIDLKTLEKYDNQIEDLLDSIIAESRAEEPTVSWTTVKKRLKKKGKL